MAFFVYVKRNGRIEPQRFDIWPTVNGKPLEVVQKHEIDKRDLHIRIKKLEIRYPYKGDTELT